MPVEVVRVGSQIRSIRGNLSGGALVPFHSYHSGTPNRGINTMNSLPSSNQLLGRLAVLAAVALVAGALAAGTASAEEWTKSYTVSGRARVHVDSNDGSVRVTTA